MNRRFMLSAVCLLTGWLTAMPGAVSAETLVLSANSPPNHWSSTEGFVPFMACVKEASKEAIDFSYFPSSQIATTAESLNAVNMGLAQISYLAITAISNKMPLSGIWMLPGMGDTATEMTNAVRKVLETDGPFAREFANNRVHPLMIVMTPPYQLMSRGEPMASLDKIAGKKISAAGGTLIHTMKVVGANPVEIGAGDAYLALQQGVVDGSALAIPSVAPYKLQEVLKSMSTNGAFGSAAVVLSIDAGVWKSLSTEKQAALRDCGLKSEGHVAGYLDELTDTMKARYAADGIRLYEFTPETRAALDDRLRHVAVDYVGRLKARGLPAEEAYEMYRKALGR